MADAWQRTHAFVLNQKQAKEGKRAKTKGAFLVAQGRARRWKGKANHRFNLKTERKQMKTNYANISIRLLAVPLVPWNKGAVVLSAILLCLLCAQLGLIILFPDAG